MHWTDATGAMLCVGCDHLLHDGQHCVHGQCACGWELSPDATLEDGTPNINYPGAVWADEPFFSLR